MTTVKLYKMHNEIYGFKIEGHSMYGNNGNDILCSAISSTSQMAINGCFTYEVHRNEDVLLFNMDESKPLIEFMLDPIHKGARHSTMLRSFEDFITELSKQYNDNIRVVVIDDGKEVIL